MSHCSCLPEISANWINWVFIPYRAIDFNHLNNGFMCVCVCVSMPFPMKPYRMQRIADNGSLPNKSRKKNEEKININIFLAQNVPELDLGSDSESGIKPAAGKTVRIETSLESQFVINFICCLFRWFFKCSAPFELKKKIRKIFAIKMRWNRRPIAWAPKHDEVNFDGKAFLWMRHDRDWCEPCQLRFVQISHHNPQTCKINSNQMYQIQIHLNDECGEKKFHHPKSNQLA